MIIENETNILLLNWSDLNCELGSPRELSGIMKKVLKIYPLFSFNPPILGSKLVV